MTETRQAASSPNGSSISCSQHSDDHDHADEHAEDHSDDHSDHDHSTTRMLEALGITTLSGMAAMLGFCFIFCLNREAVGLIPVSLSFSGGVIVYLTFLNLIPECIYLFERNQSEALAHLYASLCVIGGLLLSLCMEHLIPHSHAHEHPAVATSPHVACIFTSIFPPSVGHHPYICVFINLLNIIFLDYCIFQMG